MSTLDHVAGRSGSAAGMNYVVVAAAGLTLTGGALWLSEAFYWRAGALLILGAAFGLVLYHALFGFTSAWRVFISARRGSGLRAQMLMLAVATALFVPAVDDGNLFGRGIVGAVAPLSVSLLFGAFLFGLGMQLGGGCGSGTLYTAGGGSPRMMLTLVAFVAGSVIGTAHVPWWFGQPRLPAMSLVNELGPVGALAVQWGILAAIALLALTLERRRYGETAAPVYSAHRGFMRVVRGPWPLIWGALALAMLNWTTLIVAGHPWGITYGYTLWGAKIAQGLGIDVASWEFWTWPYHRAALHASVFENSTSTMNFGILIGALLASGLAGTFAPAWRVPWRSAAAALIGGLLMGYGARLAFGCNIGAFFSGVASASVHGWVWFVLAMLGTWAGIRLRPWFGLTVERPGP